MFTPHEWQTRAIAYFVDHFKDHAHGYMMAPTGVGKFFATFLTCEAHADPGARLIIVGATKIVEQHRKSLKAFGCTPVIDNFANCLTVTSPKGYVYTVATWQGVRAHPERYPQDVAVLVFDECHLGDNPGDSSSYRKIDKALKPRRKLHISSTAHVAEEELLGLRQDHSFVLTVSDAYKAGLLNPVQMCELECGTSATINRIEQALLGKIENLEQRSDKSLANLARKLHKEAVLGPLTRGAAQDQVVQLAIKAAKQVIEHRHNTMVKLYFDKHVGEQAIFYCANIDAANRSCAHFTKLAEGTIRAESVHVKDSHHDKYIDEFEQGKVRVLFAVGMLQEGFDMPALYLAFDCRFHRGIDEDRIARMLQRLGRLLRKAPGKPESRYYYSTDLMTYYSGMKLHGHRFLTSAMLVAAGENLERGDHTASVTVAEGEVEDFDLPEFDGQNWLPSDINDTAKEIERKVRIVRRPLYVLAGVSGFTLARTIRLSELTNSSTSENKRTLLEMAKRGEQRPPKLSRLGIALSNYTNDGNTSYDPAFDITVRHIAANWFLDANAAQTQKNLLLEMAERGDKRPAARTPLGTALQNFIAPYSRTFDQQFADTIRAKVAHWFRSNDKKLPSSAERKERLLEMGARGERRPQDTMMGQALRAFTTKGARGYAPDFDEAIRKLRPDWFNQTPPAPTWPWGI